MATVPQKELRNDVGAILRRAEAGERITVTVSGRPVAQLGPVEPGVWVDSTTVADVWRTTAPTGLDDELASVDDGESRDPFAP
jgi:prevent-host-death family protein